MFELFLFALSSLIGSGILFSHKRILTYIGFAGVLFEAQLLITSYIARGFLSEYTRDSIFLFFGITFLIVWGSQYKKWVSPYSIPGSGIRDVYVGVVILMMLALAYPIISNNGYVGDNFILHGFYNGDVVTFVSLVQKSFDTTGLVSQNPFSGNGPLEYPTVLHGSVADFFTLLGVGKDWLHYLPAMTYIGIFLTIPLFFLVWDTVWREPFHPSEKWFGIVSRQYIYFLQGVITLFTIGLSLDSFVYPQSHFFLQGLEIGLIALFARVVLLSRTEQVLPGITGGVIASSLLLSNSVTGTVAAALAGTLCFIRIFDKKRSVQERIFFLALGACVVLFMKSAMQGRTTLNTLHFSVSSAAEMLRAGLPALLVLLASIFSLSRKQYIAVSASFVAAFAFITFLLSNRAIVTENASRFLYHSFLIGFPLLLPFAVQAIYLIRRETHLTLRPMSEVIVGWIATLLLIGILFLPVGISAGSTYLSLVKSEPYTVPLETRTALWWLDEHAEPSDVIITSPHAPYIVPLFTGRATLRLHDYWLSAEDTVTNDVVAAFSGDLSAQQRILPHAKYIFLSAADAKAWNTTSLQQVFETPDAIVYQTR